MAECDLLPQPLLFNLCTHPHISLGASCSLLLPDFKHGNMHTSLKVCARQTHAHTCIQTHFNALFTSTQLPFIRFIYSIKGILLLRAHSGVASYKCYSASHTRTQRCSSVSLAFCTLLGDSSWENICGQAGV